MADPYSGDNIERHSHRTAADRPVIGTLPSLTTTGDVNAEYAIEFAPGFITSDGDEHGRTVES